MTITSILLLFHLIISLLACINPFSGCLHCFEASQVVGDANRQTGVSVMGISVEGISRAIYRIIFFVNRILLFIPVIRLALIFLIFMVYLVFFTLYCLSNLVCANLVGKSLDRFTCFDLGSTSIDAAPWSVQFFWPLFCWMERYVFSKMLINLIQYRGTAWEMSAVSILFSF